MSTALDLGAGAAAGAAAGFAACPCPVFNML